MAVVSTPEAGSGAGAPAEGDLTIPAFLRRKSSSTLLNVAGEATDANSPGTAPAAARQPDAAAPIVRIISREPLTPAPAESSTGSYSPLDGFRGVFDGLASKSAGRSERNPQDQPETIIVQQDKIADRNYVGGVISKLRSNLALILGRTNADGSVTRGLHDDTILEVKDALVNSDRRISELEDSRRLNGGAISVKRAGEVTGQEADPEDVIKVEGERKSAFESAHAAWEAKYPKPRIGKRSQEALLAEPKLNGFSNPRAPKSRDVRLKEDVYHFDPSKAEPVIAAQSKLDLATGQAKTSREALEAFWRKHPDLSEEERKTIEAICAIRGTVQLTTGSLEAGNISSDLAHVVISDDFHDNMQIESQFTTSEGQKVTINGNTIVTVGELRSKVRDLAAGIKFSAADLAQLGLKAGDTPSIKQILQYVDGRKGDKLVQEAEKLLVYKEADADNVTFLQGKRDVALEDAKQWEVTSSGREIGKGYQKLAEAQSQKNKVVRTLGDAVLIEFYLKEHYLRGLDVDASGNPNSPAIATEYENYDIAQQVITGADGLDAKILQRENDIKDPSRKDDIEYNRKKLASLREQRQQQLDLQQAALTRIFHIINPADRLKAAPALIRAENVVVVGDQLKLMGLGGSPEQIIQQQERVAQAFEQALKEIPTGKVPDERALVAKVIQILQGDKSQLELVSGNTASPAPARPDVSSAEPTGPTTPGAGAAEVTAAEVEGETAEQVADNIVHRAINAVDDETQRLADIAEGRNIIGEFIQPEQAGVQQLAWELSIMPENDRKVSLEAMRAAMSERPLLRPVVRLFDLLDKLKMGYKDLVDLGKKKDRSLNGPTAALVGLTVLLQAFSKIESESTGSAVQQPEQ